MERSQVREVTMRIALIGCSKKKFKIIHNTRTGGRITPCDLYAGSLFKKRVEYAESRGLKWYVLSAEYGIWQPNALRKPYDKSMADLSHAERAVWHTHTAYRVCDFMWDDYNDGKLDGPIKPSQLTVEIHAGTMYAHPLSSILKSIGVNVELPCAGLDIGFQLQLYTTGALSPTFAGR